MQRVDRNNSIPIFSQLEDIFREKIENGEWESNTQIPTENSLCEMFDVSLITVRKALEKLEFEGMIKRIRGKGTFVEENKVKDLILQSLTGSFAFTPMADRNFSTEVVEKNIEIPSKQVLEALDLGENDEVTKLVRIRYVDSIPMYWTKAYIPISICPTLINENFESNSLYEILKDNYGIEAISALRTIETIYASNNADNFLGLRQSAPINLVTSISYLKENKPLEYSKNYFRTDRVKFEVKINLD